MLEDGFDVLAQLEARLPAVVVRQHAEGVAVPERAVGEQPLRVEDLVELGRDVLAHGAGLDELEAAAMHLDVDLPQPQVLGGGLAQKRVRSSAV